MKIDQRRLNGRRAVSELLRAKTRYTTEEENFNEMKQPPSDR
jgi:hypothetical protein